MRANLLAFALLLLAATAWCQSPKLSPTAQGIILSAGNEEDDSARLRLLQRLADQCERDKTPLQGLDTLTQFVGRWVSIDDRLDFFNGQVQRRQDYDFGVPADSPLRPICDFYLGRMLCCVCTEYSDIYPFPEKRAVYLGKAKQLFESSAKAFPENRVIRMYLGERIPPNHVYEAPAGAPAWAVAQREGLERLADVIDWWIDKRLRQNGEYGGGWGDDCEMWRHWIPAMIGFEDPKASWAQAYFSERLLAQPHLAGGYHNRMMDVEHTAEDMSDALTPMMLLDSSNPAWSSRVLKLVDLAQNLWTGRNERGQLQFKSTYFTSEAVDPSPARACDSVYHPRALQPALLYWQRTGDPRVGKFVTEWMKTWVDATRREERGKPAGIIPTTIHWPDGAVGGVGKDWWKPENYETPLYDFPSAMSMMLNTMLLTWHMTGDEQFLEPIRSMAQARLDWLKAGRPDAPEGTRMWCASKLDVLGGVLAKYRFLTGDKKFDEIIGQEKELGYARYRINGDSSALEAGLQRIAGTIGVNFPAYTSEVRYTDRVGRFPVLYQPEWMLKDGAQPPMEIIENGVVTIGLNRLMQLYNTATGDPGDPLYFPIAAVRWRTSPRGIAALVTDSGTDRFQARLYNFGEEARKIDCELLLLDPGSYACRLGKPGEAGTALGTIAIKNDDRKFSFALPPHEESELTIARGAASAAN